MLAKRYRLTKRGSFTYVYKKGTGRTAGPIRLTYVPSKGLPKVGVSVPNTVGKAVVRNKVRRRIRAAMRGCIANVRGAQIVISAKSGAKDLSYAQIQTTLTELLTKAGLYEKENHAVARR